MRIAFISDMHGNLPALEAVLGEVERRGPFDAVIGGGDYALGGIFPEDCVLRMRTSTTTCVRGNTDEWIVEAATEGRIPARDYPPEMAHNAEMKERDRWAAERMDEDLIAFLAELPLDWDVLGPSGQSLKFVHATPWSTHPVIWSDAPEEQKREMVERGGADVLLYGHIHYPYIQEIDGKTLACIGSAGLPFDGDPRPCFAIATDEGDGWEVEHVRVDYDREGYIQELLASGMPGAEEFAEVVRTGRR